MITIPAWLIGCLAGLDAALIVVVAVMAWACHRFFQSLFGEQYTLSPPRPPSPPKVPAPAPAALEPASGAVKVAPAAGAVPPTRIGRVAQR